MRKFFRYTFIIILLVLFIPIIPVEKYNETNGTTVIDQKNLASYCYKYLEKWYLEYKENMTDGKTPSETRDESQNN